MYTLHRYSIYINTVGTLHNDLMFSPFPVPSDPHGIYHKCMEQSMCLGCAALSVVDYSTVELKCQGQLLEIEWWPLQFALIYFSPLQMKSYSMYKINVNLLEV